MQIAIIGAGIAGLSCAEAAFQNGHTVTLFDKGRGAGGRLSTRRVKTEQGELHFDHGTASFGADSIAFQQQAEDWRKAGWISEWTARHLRIQNGIASPIAPRTRYVGQPHMNSLVKALAETKDVRLSHRVSGLNRHGPKWQLSFDMGRDEPFECDQVVLAIPPEQAGELLSGCHASWAEQVMACQSVAVWSVMLGYETPLNLPFDTASLSGSGLGAVYRNQTKPGRSAGTECLVLHATPDWSMAHLDDTPEDIIVSLMSDLHSVVDRPLPPPAVKMAHRWKYGLNAKPLGAPFLLETEQGLGVCGDWLLGAGVEQGWVSGTELGKSL